MAGDGKRAGGSLQLRFTALCINCYRRKSIAAAAPSWLSVTESSFEHAQGTKQAPMDWRLTPLGIQNRW
jgi:hypothetical protein